MEANNTKPLSGTESLARLIGERHGFRAHDYALTWDAGSFDPIRDVHELAITTKDGRSATVEVAAEPLNRLNPWPYFARLDTAFATLRRRDSTRGS